VSIRKGIVVRLKVISSIIMLALVSIAAHATVDKNEPVANVNVPELIKVAQADGLNPKALKAALNAYEWAQENDKLGENKDILTVVDFSLPSYQKRMWVIDLKENEVLMKTYTSQGSRSGQVYAEEFSNETDSKRSSLGLFVTSEEYVGSHGKSIRIDGLQRGVNDNARERNLTIHPASYVADGFVRAYHRAGRTWGCFTISPALRAKFMHYVRGGSALFAYAKQIEKTPIVKNGPLPV
jgi:hypothetical protein